MLEKFKGRWTGKVLFLVFLVAVIVSSVCFTVMGAQTERQGRVTTSPGYSLNIRADATTQSSVVGSLMSGDVVTVIGEKTGMTVNGTNLWYQIRVGNIVGYVISYYIELLPVETTSPETTAPEETVPGETVPGETTPGETVPGETGGETTPEEPPVINFEEYLDEQKFPESYKTSLRALHEKYPNWIFKAQHIEYDFDYAVQNEKLQSLVWSGSISSWKSVEGDAYDWTTSTWRGFDGASWVRASEDIIRHYMDPRNFLESESVFQFIEQSYDGNIQNLEGVKTIVAGTFLANTVTDSDGSSLNYAEAIYNAGATYGANPYVLAAMLVQEQGVNGTSGLISGTYPGYVGYFNFFNVGAYAANGMNAIQRGLWYAKGGNTGATSNLRPWTTRLKAINGGAYFYADGYINRGQNTLYLKKFNVQGDNPFTHQYMTNIQGAASEATSFAKGYSEEMRQTALSFLIPVYKTMPEEACPRPVLDGSPNMKLSSLTVEGFELTPDFETDTLEYMLVVSPIVNSVKVSAVAMDPIAQISGTGELALNTGTNVFEIKVTAGNGTVRTYKLTVAKESAEEFGDLVFTENYAPKDSIIYRIVPDMTVSQFAKDLVSVGIVKVYAPDGTERAENDVIATNDKIVVSSTAGSKYGEYTASVLGDLNGDGKVTINDLLKIRNKILGTDGLSSVQIFSGDVDGGGVINISDLLKIRNHILGTTLLTK